MNVFIALNIPIIIITHAFPHNIPKPSVSNAKANIANTKFNKIGIIIATSTAQTMILPVWFPNGEKVSHACAFVMMFLQRNSTNKTNVNQNTNLKKTNTKNKRFITIIPKWCLTSISTRFK